MPHSSGGGSHGGGSHGGHHGGSRSSTRTRTSSRPFRHSRRYVYYRHNKPRYFYAGTDFQPGLRISQLIICLAIAIFGVFMLIKTIPHIPRYSDHNIVIKDEVDVISDENSVAAELKEFQKKTGITPSVITIPNEEWMNSFSSLEDYAYSRYLREFNDEMHWLIVYSQPVYKQEKRQYWYWEGMQGDKTDSVLTVNAANHFNNIFQSHLDDNESLDKALISSFSYLTDNISMTPDLDDLIMPLFIFGFAALQLFITLYEAVKYKDAVPAPLDSGNSDTYGSSGSTYGNTYSPAADNSRTFSNTDKGYYDPQQERRERILNSGQNYSHAEYMADKKARDREFNAYIDQYKQLIPNENGGGSDMMPSLEAMPSVGSITCQYCGKTFAGKYKKCPFCNASPN